MRLALLICLIALTVGAAEVNFYVDSAAAGGGDGSLGTPWNALSSVTAASVGNQVAAGNTVFVNLKCGSSFGVAWTIPTNSFGVRSYGSGASPIITGGGARTTIIDANTTVNLTFSNIVFTAGTTYGARLRSCSNFLFDACTFSDGSALATLSSATNVTFKRCIFTNCTGSSQAVLAEGTGTSFNGYFCLFSRIPSGTTFYLTGGSGRWVNCTFVGSKSSHIHTTSTGQLDLINCIFAGNNIAAYTIGLAPIVSSGVLNLTNCLVMGNGKSVGLRVQGASNEVNAVWCEPGFVSTRYPSAIGITLDDTASWPVVLETARYLTNYNSGMTWGVSSGGGGNALTATITNAMRSIVGYGSELASHGRDHCNLAASNALRVKYTAAATTATIAISGSNLVTTIDGVTDKNLNLSSASYDTLGEVITALGANYSASTYDSYVPSSIPSWALASVSAQDIKGVFYTNQFNRTVYMNFEIGFSKQEIEDIVGSGYTVDGLIYPNGQNDGLVWTNAQSSGYNYARNITVEPGAGYLLASNHVFSMNTAQNPTTGTVISLSLDSSGNDGTVTGLNFNSSNMVYVTTNVVLTGAGYFNGTTAYLTRSATDSFFNWDHQLWCMKADVWPKGLSGTQTVMWVGADANNRIAVSIASDGSVDATGKLDGTNWFSLSAASGSITNFGWQRISVEQRFNTVRLRINGVVAATATTTQKPSNNQTTAYVGCGYSGAATENFFYGLMDDVNWIGNIYWRGQSSLDQMCEEGVGVPMYSHGGPQCPPEPMRIYVDSAFESTSRHYWFTASQLANYWRTNGAYSAADGMTIVRTNVWDAAADYRLRSDSQAVTAGNISHVSGVTALSDLDGTRITDDSGSLQVGFVSVGAYQFIPPRTTITTFNVGTLTIGQ